MLWNKNKVTIIAEIGTNHEGDLDLAIDLIRSTADAGADIVKFQSFIADELISKFDKNYERIKSLELKKEWYPILIEECKAKDVKFLSTATSFTTLKWMEEYNVEGYKVASSNISYTQIIDKLIVLKKPIILSTGMAGLDEINGLHMKLKENGVEHVFLHCVSKYPVEPHEMNLANIQYLLDNLDCEIGFSDHSLGDTMGVAAVSLGAKIIEKHVTADKNGKGMDNAVSLLPDEFRSYCSSIRETEKALKVNFDQNNSINSTYRRSLHFSQNLTKGSIINMSDVCTIRPEDGIKPSYLNEVIGKKVKDSVTKGTAIKWDLIE